MDERQNLDERATPTPENEGRQTYASALDQSQLSFLQYHVGRYLKHGWKQIRGLLGDFNSLGGSLLSNFGVAGFLLQEEVTSLFQELRDLPETTLSMWRNGNFLLPLRNLEDFLEMLKEIKADFLLEFGYTWKKAKIAYAEKWSPTCKAYVGGVLFLSLFTLYNVKLKPWVRHRIYNEINCLQKTVVITGASSGIGYRLAYEFAKRGAFVVITSPDMVKARKARLDLSRMLIRYIDKQKKRVIEQAQVRYYEQLTIPPQNNIHFLLQNLVEVELDLACTASIYSFARKLHGMSPDGIDILINNAAVNIPPEEMVVTDQGKEVHFSVNYFGHFVLTNLLIGMLAMRKGSKIINITCKDAAQKGFIKLEEFIGPYLEDDGLPFLPAQNGYEDSKLAVYLFNRHLSKELQFSGINNVTTYCVCPGTTRTNLNRYIKHPYSSSKTWNYYLSAFHKKEWQAAQCVLHCALSLVCSHESGFFYENNRRCSLRTKHPDQDVVAQKLWQASLTLMGVGHSSMLRLTEQMHILSHENIYQLANNLFLHRRDVMTYLLLIEEKLAFKRRHKKHVDERGDARDDFTYFWHGFYLSGGENSTLIERWVLHNTHPGFRELQKEYDVWFECTGSSHFHPVGDGKMASLQYMHSMGEQLTQDDIEELESLYDADSEPDEEVENKERFYKDYVSVEEFL